MDKYVWLFPVIFIIHDMEEIIGIGIWLRKNKELIEQK
ncbi:MAG: HXXEE domain-containing protein, partial [Ruminococcus sp.]|nr:HXXEE domain-containing protein [Ruminococcus sp.]